MKHLDIQDSELSVVRSDQSEAWECSVTDLGGSAGVGARKIDQSIAYMREHLNKPLQVAKLAALVNVSASHYFALFKRRTGCAPIDFFIRLRMRQACRLLCATSLSVKEVAAALGYEDPFYFSRMFKSVVQVAPSEYRVLTQGTDPVQGLRRAGVATQFPSESRNRRPSYNLRKNVAASEHGASAVVGETLPTCAALGV